MHPITLLRDPLPAPLELEGAPRPGPALRTHPPAPPPHSTPHAPPTGQALEKKWMERSVGPEYLPGARDREDVDQAGQFFSLLGWRDEEGVPLGPGEAADDLLNQLLKRAIKYRMRYDVWWERMRDRPEERGAGFVCDVDWSVEPWASDRLGGLMEAEMTRLDRGAEDATTNTAGGTMTGHGPPSIDIVDMAPVASGGMDFVDFTVRLLGKSRLDDLRRAKDLVGRPKRLAVYRAVRGGKG
ncbi:hypothetical protein TSOC_000935 [Tetrabaena socialis]|uniref:Uncharacterized protein n=1 Tax=Tetrabaena socialis TaxID=47790 RepID=A0A2J8AI04_9CHLO|nr:hypothetical protein TSOC_000935 [Tetrabaena socialis]|eukprot:PNH12140.1 hypothetical protein TSOC_000935 [Tetrabaena socialis]